MTDDVLKIAEDLRSAAEWCEMHYDGKYDIPFAEKLLAYATEIAEARRLKAQTCETCSKSATWAGQLCCVGPANGEPCGNFGNLCGSWWAK